MTPAIPRALAILLFVLGTSVPAHAHDESHGDAHQAETAGGHIDASPHHRLSPSCPGTPGQLCCCGNLVAATGGAKLPLVAGNSWHLVPSAEAAEQEPVHSFPPVKTAVPSGARPRAPPVSS
jgi:hypothetical protein